VHCGECGCSTRTSVMLNGILMRAGSPHSPEKHPTQEEGFMSNEIDTSSIESILHEKRLFQPPADFTARAGGAYIASMEQYRQLHERSIADPEGFWAEVAQQLHWFKPWDKVLEWNLPDAKWFVGGKTNICYNCVDRHVDNGYGDQTAIIW